MAGNAVGVLDDDPVGKLKVFVYEMPRKYNKMLLDKDSWCLPGVSAQMIFPALAAVVPARVDNSRAVPVRVDKYAQLFPARPILSPGKENIKYS